MSQTRSIVASGTAAVVLLGFGTWILFADPSRMSELGGPLVVTNATETDPPPSASPAATTGPTPAGTALAVPPARQVTRPAAAASPSASSGDDVGALTTTSAASPSPDDTMTSSSPRANGKPANGSDKTSPGSGRDDAATPGPTSPGTAETSGTSGTSGTSTSNVDESHGWFTVSPPWARR